MSDKEVECSNQEYFAWKSASLLGQRPLFVLIKELQERGPKERVPERVPFFEERGRNE